jgi:hypothetical protein
MLCTAELDMAKSVAPNEVDVFLDNTAWGICSTYHTVLKASPGTAIFGNNMLFDIPLVADRNKIGDYRQHQTKKVGNKVLVKQDGILCKAENPYSKKPLTIRTIFINGTIRIPCRTQME